MFQEVVMEDGLEVGADLSIASESLRVVCAFAHVNHACGIAPCVR